MLLERMDERDQKTDQSTRKQMKIAVWSVGISAVIAVFALIVSVFAYMQDKDNGKSGDKFQAELLAAVKEGNQTRASFEEENKQLKTRVDELTETVARLNSAQSHPANTPMRTRNQSPRNLHQMGD